MTPKAQDYKIFRIKPAMKNTYINPVYLYLAFNHAKLCRYNLIATGTQALAFSHGNPQLSSRNKPNKYLVI